MRGERYLSVARARLGSLLLRDPRPALARAFARASVALPGVLVGPLVDPEAAARGLDDVPCDALGFGVQGLGVWVQGLGVWVQGLGIWVQGLRFRV